MRCWYKNSFAQAFDQMNNVVNGLVSKRLVKAEIWKRHQSRYLASSSLTETIYAGLLVHIHVCYEGILFCGKT